MRIISNISFPMWLIATTNIFFTIFTILLIRNICECNTYVCICMLSLCAVKLAHSMEYTDYTIKEFRDKPIGISRAPYCITKENQKYSGVFRNREMCLTTVPCICPQNQLFLIFDSADGSTIYALVYLNSHTQTYSGCTIIDFDLNNQLL